MPIWPFRVHSNSSAKLPAFPHPYVRPQSPPPLVIPAYQLPHVVQTETAHPNEQVWLFNECNNVEQA